MSMMMTHAFSFLSSFQAKNKNTHLHIDQNKNIHAGGYYKEQYSKAISFEIK